MLWLLGGAVLSYLVLSDDWAKVEGFPYWVSSDGRVWSEHTEKVLKPYTNESDTYEVVDLYSGNGTRKQRLLHGLVMQYHGPERPGPGTEINHIDGVPTHNDVTNLEWVKSATHATESHGGPGSDEGAGALAPTDDAPF